MRTNSLTILYLRVDEVRPYANPVRNHNRATLQKLRKLIGHFGQVVPIIVDPNYVIIDGHAVHTVLRELGAEQIAVVMASGRSEAELRALRLALNQIPQDAKWDNERLRAEFSALVALSFDMELTAFDTVEIDALLDIDAPETNVVENGDDLPPRPDHPITQPGDLWLCGRHRVVCGDALNAAARDCLLDGNRPAMAFLDPPYNVPVDGFVSGLGRIRHREFVQGSGEMSSAQFEAFLEGTLNALKSSLSEGAVSFVCMDWRHLYELLSAGRRCEVEVLNLCVWAKTTGMGSLYRSQHELVAVFRSSGAPHRNNVKLGRHGRHRSNLWTYRGLNTFGADRDALLAAHPTVKPAAMISDAIRDVTRRNDSVLDLFLGSGSTLIAAEDTGRRCFAMDLDPAYVDVAVRRWQQHTGQDAVHAGTGGIFADVSAAAEAHEDGGSDAR